MSAAAYPPLRSGGGGPAKPVEGAQARAMAGRTPLAVVPPPPPDVEPLDERTARQVARERPGCNGPFLTAFGGLVVVAIVAVAMAYAHAHGWRPFG